MGHVFDPDELHALARLGVGAPTLAEAFETVAQALARRHPDHVRLDNPWLFNNAGGAMGQIKLLHCSLTEYVLLFGTPIGTEGHSGRYATEVWDFVIDGEMWCYHAGELERAVYRPGDAAYLGADRAKGYRVPDHAWMLEYARGPIPTMLPFGLADTLLSTLDWRTAASTVWQYAAMVVRELARGKV